MTDDPALKRLRAHFARHNRLVLGLSLVTFLAAGASWALLYAAAYWLVLLSLSVSRGADAMAPQAFPFVFAGVALALCLLAWLMRRHSPDGLPRDRKRPWELALDLLLMVPRMTLATGETLTAWISLDRHEASLALALLRRIEHEKTLPVHAVPAEIPDVRAREKILIALQVSDLVVSRRTEGGNARGAGGGGADGRVLILALHSEVARELCREYVRLRLKS